MSIASTIKFAVSEQLDAAEVRNLLLCFLYITSNLPNDALHGFWKESTTDEQIDFLQVLGSAYFLIVVVCIDCQWC